MTSIYNHVIMTSMKSFFFNIFRLMATEIWFLPKNQQYDVLMTSNYVMYQSSYTQMLTCTIIFVAVSQAVLELQRGRLRSTRSQETKIPVSLKKLRSLKTSYQLDPRKEIKFTSSQRTSRTQFVKRSVAFRGYLQPSWTTNLTCYRGPCLLITLLMITFQIKGSQGRAYG